MSAVNKLAEILRVRPSVFSYAGTKDKRAITVQLVCAQRIDAGRLSSLNSRLRSMSVGSFSYQPAPLKLGDLSGNHFTVILRELPVDTESTAVAKVMDSLKQNGFINYFGMQRFGSSTVPTFEIGLFLDCVGSENNFYIFSSMIPMWEKTILFELI